MNTLADFPADRFAIHAYCDCGHSAKVNTGALPAHLTIDELKARLCCQACRRRGVRITIAWTACGGFQYG